MKRTLALGLAGALAAGAALIGTAEPARAQFGFSVGFGTPAYYGWGYGHPHASVGWGSAYGPYGYSWGGPAYVGSYYAPSAVVAAPAYDYYEANPVVTTRRVVTSAPIFDADVASTGGVATVGDAYYEPRRVMRTRRVVTRMPAHRATRVGTRRAQMVQPMVDPSPRAVTRHRLISAEPDYWADDDMTTGSITTRRVIRNEPGLRY